MYSDTCSRHVKRKTFNQKFLRDLNNQTHKLLFLGARKCLSVNSSEYDIIYQLIY